MRKPIFSFLGFLITFLFVALTSLALFWVWEFSNQPAFGAKLVFVVLNFIVLLGVFSFARAMLSYLSVAHFSAIAVMTLIYSLFQFAGLWVSYDAEQIKGFVLYQLIVLAFYFVIVLPIAAMGIKHGKMK